MSAPLHPPDEIVPQLLQARTVLEQHLGGALQALHLFGSAVDGGLRPHSDIDLLATVSAPLAASTRGALMTALLSASAPPGTKGTRRPLEVTVLVREDVVPWRYPPRRELQFGEWLREALAAGVVEPPMLDHDLAILLTKVRQHGISLAGPPAAAWFDAVPKADLTRALLDTVAQWNEPPDWRGDERNVVLALARVWFSACTGEIASKDAAAAWVLERLPQAHRPVLASARAGYLGHAEDALADRPQEVAAFVRHARAAVEQVCAAAAPRAG